MAIKGKITNNKFIDVKHSVISASNSTDLEYEFSGNELIRVNKVFHFYDAIDPEALGLGKQADISEIKNLLERLSQDREASLNKQMEIVSSSKVSKWIAAGNSVADLTIKLLGLLGIVPITT